MILIERLRRKSDQDSKEAADRIEAAMELLDGVDADDLYGMTGLPRKDCQRLLEVFWHGEY